MGSRHWIYYHCFSARKINIKRKRLTLNNHILTGLLVPLTLATDCVSEGIALMLEGLTVLTHWDLLHQPALGMEDQ